MPKNPCFQHRVGQPRILVSGERLIPPSPSFVGMAQLVMRPPHLVVHVDHEGPPAERFARLDGGLQYLNRLRDGAQLQMRFGEHELGASSRLGQDPRPRQ